jgi:hypothetical protein
METKQLIEKSERDIISPWQAGLICALIWFILESVYGIFGKGFAGWYMNIGIYISVSLGIGLLNCIFVLYKRRKRGNDKPG